MEPETISNNGAISKSLMSRGNFLKSACFSLLAAAALIMSGCDKDGDDKDKEKEKDPETQDVYLLKEISYVNEDGSSKSTFEYDAQNRITKITDSEGSGEDAWTGVSTFDYNEDGDLVHIVDPDEDDIFFVKSGNTITVTYSWDEDWTEKLELNAQGLLAKVTSEDSWNDGESSWKEVVTYTYQGKNATKAQGEFVSNWVDWEDGEPREETNTWSATITYDDKNSPFYHCQTPQWYLVWFCGYGVQNNIKKIDYDNGSYETFAYEYNEAGYPASRDVFEHWFSYYEEEEEEDIFEEREYTETFTYNTLQKSALNEVPTRPNSGSMSPKKALNRKSFISRLGNHGKYSQKR